jgi:hypothetical protein
MKFGEVFEKFLAKVMGRLPNALPKGMWEFDNFAQQIFYTYDLPDLPSYRQAIATMIMHLPPQTDRVPLVYFAKSLRKSMANQIAYETIQQIKEAEKSTAAETSEPV